MAPAPTRRSVLAMNRIIVNTTTTIGVVSQKGGAGKTTVSVNLAAAFAANGQRVLLVDADPQGTALKWSAVRDREPLFPVVGMPKATLHKDIRGVARDFDVVVIDAPPHNNDVGRSVIAASDLIVIPVQPSGPDVWSTADTVRLIHEAQQFRDNLNSVIVINRKIVGTALARDVITAVNGLGMPVAKTHLCQRIAYAECITQGLTLAETEPKGGAAKEFSRFVAELRTTKERMVA